MKALQGVRLLVGALLIFSVVTAAQAMAATPDEDIRPIRTGVTINGLVEDDYSDGLIVSTDDGLSYVVLTPESVSLEQEEAFHKRNKGKQVTLTGDVYKDEDGTLSLFVKDLPQ